jgi:YegS/Rv2252/BmrU family lipid kinase
MNLTLILNHDAGTLRGLDAGEAAETLAAAFRDRGHAVAVELHEGAQAIEAIRRVCRGQESDAVIVGGGDGTISAAAAAAAECGIALGVLPLGTMNLFARSLGIPIEMQAAAVALAEGQIASVDICEVNGRLFIHHVAVGMHAKLVRVRERMTYASRHGKVWASLQAWWTVVRAPPRLDAEIRADDWAFRRRTAAILVSNNLLGEGHLPYADDPRDGELGLYVVRSRRLPDLVRLTARLAVGAIATEPHLEQWQARSVEITLAASSIDASVDGEVVSLATPLLCRSHPRGLRVLRPAS